MDRRTRIQVETVFRIVDRLDFYQLLKASPATDRSALERSFLAESRRYHPDRFFSEDADLRNKSTYIFRRISEAWSVMKNQKLRAVYDRKHAAGQDLVGTTKADLEAEVEAEEAGLGSMAKTLLAKKHLLRAQHAERGNEWHAAVVHAEFALGVEPENDAIRQYVERARAQANQRKQTA